MLVFMSTVTLKALELKSCLFLMVLFVVVYSPLEKKPAPFYFTNWFDEVLLHIDEHLARGNNRCEQLICVFKLETVTEMSPIKHTNRTMEGVRESERVSFSEVGFI